MLAGGRGDGPKESFRRLQKGVPRCLAVLGHARSSVESHSGTASSSGKPLDSNLFKSIHNDMDPR